MKRDYEYERIEKRRNEDEMRRKMAEDNEESSLVNQQLMEEEKTKWENLSNEDEAVQEDDLEADYIIDRPPTPEFIPNKDGIDKETQVIDSELFDFELEVEPILQVLVGKCCENARIEAIEEWEVDELDEHKRKYLQIKEAELMETQRMEAARNRRRREMERRALQHRTAKDQRYRASLKMCARSMAKDFMGNFRRDTFQELRDTGLLRDPRQFSLVSHFLPALANQTMSEITRKKEFSETTDGYTMNTLRNTQRQHNQAISKEYKRREDKRREKLRVKKEKEEAKRLRREARAAERERKRVQALRNRIVTEVVNPAPIIDTLKVDSQPIADVRDPNALDGSIYIIGGLTAELLITFTCLHDYILSNPQNQNFAFTKENLRKFLKDLLIGYSFPDGALTLNVHERQKGTEEEEGKLVDELDNDTIMRHCLTSQYMNDYGLQFFFKICKDLGISKDIIKAMYETIVEIAKYKEQEPTPIPDAPVAPEPTEEQKAADPPVVPTVSEEEKKNHEAQVNAIKDLNVQKETKNEELKKLQEKIKINYRDTDFQDNGECCIVKLENYRDPPVEEEDHPSLNEGKHDSKLNKSKQSANLQKDEGEGVEINFESVPPRIIVPNARMDGLESIVIHTGK